MKLAAFVFTLIVLQGFGSKAEETIDLQWSICGGTPTQVLKRLDPPDQTPSKIAYVTYFDTRPATFAQEEISFRVKKNKNKIESSVKVRFDDDSNTPDNADCAWDRYGSKLAYTCEIKYALDKKSDKIWSKKQTQFVSKYQSFDSDKLVEFGPFENPKWELDAADYDATFDSAEVGDSVHIMELSVKVPKSEEKAAYREVTKYLKKIGVDLCQIQEGKTMRYFRAQGLYP